MHENELSRVVVDGALTVHRALGPGLLESVYELALAHALAQRGLSVERQVPIPIAYQGVVLGEGFRADLIVEGNVLLESLAGAQIRRASDCAAPQADPDRSSPDRPQARATAQLRRRADERRHRPLRQRLGRMTRAQPGERYLAQRRKGAEKKRRREKSGK